MAGLAGLDSAVNRIRNIKEILNNKKLREDATQTDIPWSKHKIGA